MTTLLEMRAVDVTFRSFGRAPVTALDDVYLRVEEGTITGLVGESGSGKTTALRCCVGLQRPDDGEVVYDGVDVVRARGAERKRLRREIQLVHQDPTSSLDPRMTVQQIVSEGMAVHGLHPKGRRDRVAELLESVGLDARDLDRYPRSFSGGQRQRIAIARALAVEPRLLVCDEPVSALDVSVQAQILNLLQDMQESLGLTILFVAHDLAVVRQICAQVTVLHNGRLVEEGPADAVLGAPREAYTRALLAAVPVPDPSVRGVA
ncbi:ATP-binding cassette domain-containing protein [Pseudonocardia sp. WMMC193]|uniref:ATP-binding cassette domain-containing protein n=1 Tax=Pseudonocardia sp. WMMC193 TaxID=2911965 RepID=UPI001F00EB2E|nr:ATP-binding cassette domain-containing protein [Pseudonocardia sp. WMMC193]MCF7552733.1 ATP-binding cassette domain-containing protein [Pseudonocardia sp. WMMC193]